MNDVVTDPLAALLPSAADADRPWLVWYAPGERVELTGHVLHMWQCKIANLLAEETIGTGIHADLEEGPLVHLGLGAHWRTIIWCCGVWLAGGAVTFMPSTHEGGSHPVAQGQRRPVEVSVAFTSSGLDADADLQVLVPRESLAVRWPGSLPPMVLDGVADVISRADSFPARPLDGHRAAVLTTLTASPTSAAGADAVSAEISRDALVAGLVASSPPAGGAERPTAPDRRVDGPSNAGNTGNTSVLVRAGTALEAVRGVLTAWRADRCAVLISPDADADLLNTAARQEGAEPHPSR